MNIPPILAAVSTRGPVLAIQGERRTPTPIAPIAPVKAIELIPVEPLPSEPSLTFGSRFTDIEGEGGGVEMVDLPSYPQTALGPEMRRLRRDLGLMLGEAGRVLGHDAAAFSMLERGGYALSYAEQERAFILLKAAGEANRGAGRAGRVGA